MYACLHALVMHARAIDRAHSGTHHTRQQSNNVVSRKYELVYRALTREAYTRTERYRRKHKHAPPEKTNPPPLPPCARPPQVKEELQRRAALCEPHGTDGCVTQTVGKDNLRLSLHTVSICRRRGRLRRWSTVWRSTAAGGECLSFRNCHIINRWAAQRL